MTPTGCPTCAYQGYLPRYPDGMTLVAWPCPHEAPAPGIWTRVWRWIRRLWK